MNDEIKATIPNNMESKIIEIDPVSEDTKKNVSLHKPCSRLAAQVLATLPMKSRTPLIFDQFK